MTGQIVMSKSSDIVRLIGQRIRDLRAEYAAGAGISQEELAKAVDTTANTISRWETGVYKPSIEDLERLARHFGVSITSFFPDQAPSPDEPISALLRAANGLGSEDMEELRRYAEFRRMRGSLSKPNK